MDEGLIEELDINQEIKESYFYEIHRPALTLYIYLVFSSRDGIVKRSLESLSKEVGLKSDQAREYLNNLIDFGFIEMYKHPVHKKWFIIAVRKNEYAWFEGEEVFLDLEPFRFKTGSRSESGYGKWRTSCLKRDNYKCQMCGSTENIHVHHIKPYKDFPELRTKVSNGISLCKKCHMEVHRSMRESDENG